MPAFVHLHRQALASWVFQEPRRWHLFTYLLMRADEQGRAELSVNAYARSFGIDRSWLRRTLAEMADRHIIDQQTTNRTTIVTICKYATYNPTATPPDLAGDQPATIAAVFQEEREEETTKESSKERSKEEEKEEESGRGTFSKKKSKKKYEELCLFFERMGTIDVRRQRFRDEVGRYSSWIPQHFRDSFFDNWAEATPDNRLMKFELEPTFGVGARLRSWMKHGKKLEDEHQARLARAQGRPRPRPLSRMAKALDEEAQAAYDRYFNELESSREMRPRMSENTETNGNGRQYDTEICNHGMPTSSSQRGED